MSSNTEDFKNIIEYIEVDPKGKLLINRLNDLKNQNKAYSDLIDKNDNYYINLVQEGGGTLGIALVGFTFVLEYCKIRFLNLAGTSAGAINTILLHHLDTPDKAKSPRLFNVVKEQDFKNFIDGNRVTRFIITNILNKTGIVDALGIVFISLLLLLLTIIPILAMISDATGTMYLIVVSLFLLAIVGFFLYYKSIKKNKFGLNNGEAFLEFMKQNIPEKNINNMDNIKPSFKNASSKIDDSIEQFKINYESNPQIEITEEKVNEALTKNKRLVKPIDEYKTSYTVITSETITENKVEFPRDTDLFWTNELNDCPHPAEFARASMSIPLFFKPYIKDINDKHPSIIKAWKTKMNYGNGNANEIPDEVWFTDGGTLSNFPINIFHDPTVIIARLPVIGARLQDSESEKNTSFTGLFSFLYAIFNTARFNYDKSFLRLIFL
jgi:NTE family protein